MDSEVFRKILPAEFHRHLLMENRRADSRAFHTYRQPIVATNVLSNCSGSASVRCGNSYYLAGVRCEVRRPIEVQGVRLPCNESHSPSSPPAPGARILDTNNTNSAAGHVSETNASTTVFTTGQVSVSVEFPKICGAEFRDSGGPCTQIPLLVSGVVADLLNSPAVLNKRQFLFSYHTNPPVPTCAMRPVGPGSVQSDGIPDNAATSTTTLEGQAEAGSCPESEYTIVGGARGCNLTQYAWHLSIHVLCLKYDGNPLDFALMAAVAALEDTCLPGVVWDENAKWWRVLPSSAQQESPWTARSAIINYGPSSSKPGSTQENTEVAACFVPARKVRLQERPVAVTFSHLLSAYWVVDPTKEEEALGSWLTICLIKDRWEITRFGGPPVNVEVLGTLKSVAGVIAKGVKRLVKVPDRNA